MTHPPTTIPPAYAIGDAVTFQARLGVVTEVYAGSGIPQWRGTQCVVYTHVYAVLVRGVTTWGVVEWELERGE